LRETLLRRTDFSTSKDNLYVVSLIGNANEPNRFDGNDNVASTNQHRSGCR
jgi:hypothetical protein